MSKFLVIRFSSIGDIVLTTPVVRCIKEQVENSEVHFLTKRAYRDVIEPNTHIDRFHYYNDNLSEVLDELKSEGFDYIIDLHNNIRTYRIKQQLRVKSYAFPKLNFEKWLLVNFKMNRLPHVHIVDRYLQTVNHLGVKNDGKGLDYFIPADSKVDKNDLPASFSGGYIAFVIGAKHQTKMFPVSKAINIIKKAGKPTVLLGGKEDRERGEQISDACKDLCYNAAGQYNLNESASLIEQSNLVISNDTGLMHIAAALQKNIISIWGNTVPEFGMYPYVDDSKSKVFEVDDLSCRPCTKLGFDKCPKKHFNCMMQQDNDSIVESINDLIRS